MDENVVRSALIEEADRLSRQDDYTLQATQVLVRVSNTLGIRGVARRAEQQLLLTIWGDLFREGIIAWGADIDNMNPPFCHLTDRGRRALRNRSRDPSDPGGYMAYLDSLTPLDPIARSYIEEALSTYRNQCWKATAVMVGGASERLALLLRDAVLAQLRTSGKLATLNQGTQTDLQNYRISRVLTAIQRVMDPLALGMAQGLRETYGTYWQPFAGQARLARNDAGHPKSVDPVDEPAVHAALLTFPLYAKLTADLIDWIPVGVV